MGGVLLSGNMKTVLCFLGFLEGPTCQMKRLFSILWVSLLMWRPIVLTLLSCHWLFTIIIDVAQFPTAQYLKNSLT